MDRHQRRGSRFSHEHSSESRRAEIPRGARRCPAVCLRCGSRSDQDLRTSGLRREFVDAALEVTGPEVRAPQPDRAGTRAAVYGAHGRCRSRKEPRFPRTAAAEAAARQMITDAILKEQELQGSGLIGIAGGACGGDILFHEICEELEIPTSCSRVAKDTFRCELRATRRPRWVERFNRLCTRLPPRVLEESRPGLPNWLRGRKGLRHLAPQQPVDAVQRAGVRSPSDAHRTVGSGPGGRPRRDARSRRPGAGTRDRRSTGSRRST